MKAKILAFPLLKGAGPKTTAAVETCNSLVLRSLSASKGKAGMKILLVDLDPQVVCSTRYVGLDPDKAMPNLYHVFLKKVPVRDAIKKIPFGFEVLPSNSLFDAIDEALEKKDDLMLRETLRDLRHDYDYIIIDPPPGRRRLTINAILAADFLIIPITAESTGLEAASHTIRFVQEVLAADYPEIIANQGLKLLFAKYRRSRNSHAPGIFQAAKKVYGDNVLDFRVPDTLEFPRSYGKRQPLTYRLPEHPAAKVYSDFAAWVISNIE
jgi:chromosome partitioning protein